MDDQRREEAPVETVQAWGSARRVREPVAWALLALTAIGLLISAWELFGLPGTPPINAPVSTPVPVPVTTFGLRAAVVADTQTTAAAGQSLDQPAPRNHRDGGDTTEELSHLVSQRD